MEITQQSYNMLIEYIGLNMRSAGLMASTKYTGFVRWHNRNHEIYDKYVRKLSKYFGNMYTDVAKGYHAKSLDYEMPASIPAHLIAWIKTLEIMKIDSYHFYAEACTMNDLCLAEVFKDINKNVNNELFALKRLQKRIKDANESDVMFVNKSIHDFFESSPDCQKIDLSL